MAPLLPHLTIQVCPTWSPMRPSPVTTPRPTRPGRSPLSPRQSPGTPNTRNLCLITQVTPDVICGEGGLPPLFLVCLLWPGMVVTAPSVWVGWIGSGELWLRVRGRCNELDVLNRLPGVSCLSQSPYKWLFFSVDILQGSKCN